LIALAVTAQSGRFEGVPRGADGATGGWARGHEQVLGSAMKLVAKGVMLAMLPRFVDLLTRDYARWASNADRVAAVGSLTTAAVPKPEQAESGESAVPPAASDDATEQHGEVLVETRQRGS
jgi:hypothetical protein